MSETVNRPTAADLAALANPWAFLLRRYGRNPLGFVEEVLGVTPEPWQRKVLVAIGAGHTRISIRSGHAVGKTALLAWLLIWFQCTMIPGKGVVTAPSAPQLYDALWAELLSWIKKLPQRWQDLLGPTTDRVVLKSSPADSFITARTSRPEAPEVMQGIHSQHVLLVVDEASGVHDNVFESARSAMATRGAITILAGNPNYAHGFFWDTHVNPRGRWWTLKVGASESSRADPEYARETAEKYGVESNIYRIRVLGEFPLADGDRWIPLNLVEEAMLRNPEVGTNEPEIWGLDCARSLDGDQTCLVKRKGYWVTEMPRRWNTMDTQKVVGFIKAEWDMMDADARPGAIGVDTIGIGGPVADQLRALGLPAVDVVVSNNADEAKDRIAAHRLRDDLWVLGREWLSSGRVSMPADDMLKASLCAPRYDFPGGRFRIETKDSVRKHLHRSPDDADALLLTLAPQVVNAALSAAGGGLKWNAPLRRNLAGIV